VLLIAAGGSDEEDLNREYAAAIGDSASLWVVPDSPHTGGLETHPVDYETRVVGFFDRTLLDGVF
jgi:hypothetical protein